MAGVVAEGEEAAGADAAGGVAGESAADNARVPNKNPEIKARGVFMAGARGYI